MNWNPRIVLSAPALTGAVALGACNTATTAPEPVAPQLNHKQSDLENFNEKFTFVVVIDMQTVIIEASSKRHVKHNKTDTFTTCSYFSEGYQEYLGYFTSSGFASNDPAEVEGFCVGNFDGREAG